MNNRRAIVLATLAVAAVGVIAIATLRGMSPAAPDAAPVPPMSPGPSNADAVGAAAAPTTAGASPAPEAPAPWLQGADAAGTSANGASAMPHARDPERDRQLRELQQSMQAMLGEASRRSEATDAHLRKALDTLDQMNDPAITAQINLAAVRQNLETTIRMRDLSGELQQLMAQPPSAERQRQLDARFARFRQLQSQLRTDVRAAGADIQAAGASNASNTVQ